MKQLFIWDEAMDFAPRAINRASSAASPAGVALAGALPVPVNGKTSNLLSGKVVKLAGLPEKYGYFIFEQQLKAFAK